MDGTSAPLSPLPSVPCFLMHPALINPDMVGMLIKLQKTGYGAAMLSRECLNLSCLPKPSFADMACRVGDMSAT